ERIAQRQQWYDRQVDALKPRGRPLKVAMVYRQHHRAPGGRIEGARQPVLHAPVKLVQALEEEVGRGLRPLGLVAFAFLVGFGHGNLSPLVASWPWHREGWQRHSFVTCTPA